MTATVAQYFRPARLDSALDALAQESWRVLAGGTDVYASASHPAKTNLLDLGALRELEGIAAIADGWRIGASTSWSTLIEAKLPPWFDGLKAAAREIGGVQIQNVATIAGNVCNASPAADGTVALLALDARVILQSATAQREVALSDFVLGPRRTALQSDELVVAFVIPQRSPRARSAFVKLGHRRYLVISTAILAIVIDVDEDARISSAAIAVGALSPKAVRLDALEHDLLGKPLQPGLGELAQQHHLAPLAPISDVRASRAYRLDAGRTQLRRMLEGLAA